MKKIFETKITLKQLISYGAGIPALVVAFGEIEVLAFWWIQPLALIVGIAILGWNGAFKEETPARQYQIQRRKI